MTVAGRTVLVTRPAEDAAAWCAEIERRGGRPVVLPCLVTEPVRDRATRAAFAAALDGAAWLALTSRRAVDAVAELLAGAALPDGVRVAAVGPATAAAARTALGRADLVAREGHGASLARDLAASLVAPAANGPDAPRRVVVPAADRAGRQLEEVLEPLGIEVVRLTVYRTLPAPEADEKQDLAALGVDAVLLASPSAAEGLVHQAVVPETTQVISIGPSTTEAARRFGLRVAAEAVRPGLEGLLEAVP